MVKSAGFIIIDNSNPKKLRVLCLKSFNNWDFPKGRQEENESLFETAIRETEEETGLTPVDYSFLNSSAPPITYHSGKNTKTATYFIAQRTSNKMPTLPINPALGHPEHDEWCWFPIDVLRRVMPTRLLPIISYLEARTI